MLKKYGAIAGLIGAVLTVLLSPEYASLLPPTIVKYIGLINTLLAALGGSLIGRMSKSEK